MAGRARLLLGEADAAELRVAEDGVGEEALVAPAVLAVAPATLGGVRLRARPGDGAGG